VPDSLACHAYRPHTPVPLARCVLIQPSSVAVVVPVVMVMAPEVRRRVRRKSVSWSLSRRTRPAGPRPPPAVELVISNTCAAAAAAGGKLRRTATRWCSRLIRGMRRRGRLTFSRSRYRSDPRKVPREKALVLENHGEVLMENSARRGGFGVSAGKSCDVKVKVVNSGTAGKVSILIIMLQNTRRFGIGKVLENASFESQ